ncbi:restin-like protein [Reticulomyxa filosa]|uniref:Restin-like protein n=1 Tax=Reticulomyxa filosa TaxID=46433 RepID=X6MEH3_RETFI|nr:restin-like protein [Reticulomyxa filosa]|eukprot:ETO11435.1 restin-like protein [Reticulomyxa filosa]
MKRFCIFFHFEKESYSFFVTKYYLKSINFSRIKSQMFSNIHLKGPFFFVDYTVCRKKTEDGIELRKQFGDNDGSLQGTRYFQCQKNYGVFVKSNLKIAKIDVFYSHSNKQTKKRAKDLTPKSNLIPSCTKLCECFFKINFKKKKRYSSGRKQTMGSQTGREEKFSEISETSKKKKKKK